MLGGVEMKGYGMMKEGVMPMLLGMVMLMGPLSVMAGSTEIVVEVPVDRSRYILTRDTPGSFFCRVLDENGEFIRDAVVSMPNRLVAERYSGDTFTLSMRITTDLRHPFKRGDIVECGYRSDDPNVYNGDGAVYLVRYRIPYSETR